MRQPVHVDFVTPEEFLAELSNHQQAVSWNVVRVCTRATYTGQLNFRRLTLVATAIVALGGVLLRLRCPIGELTGLAADLNVLAEARELSDLITAAAKRRGLDVRGGVFNLEPGL